MRNSSVNDIAFAIVTETTEAVNTAMAMIRETEIAASAKIRAVGFTNCRGCQAGLENFLIEYPDCSDDAVQSFLEDVVFLACQPCTQEFNAWIDAQYQEYSEKRDAMIDAPSDWERQNLEVAK